MARLIKILMSMDTQYLQDLLRGQMYLSKRRLQVISIAITLSIGALILVRAGTIERRNAADFERADVVITDHSVPSAAGHSLDYSSGFFIT